MGVDRRKRGAQPGNVNALKHGEYSKRLRQVTPFDADTAIATGLDDEIAMLRVAMRRVFRFAEEDDQQDIKTWGNALNLLSGASARLASLLKTQQQLGNEGDVVLEALNQALAEVTRELNGD